MIRAATASLYVFVEIHLCLSLHDSHKTAVMSNKRFEEVPFLNEEGGLSEKDDLPADPIRHQRRYYCIRKTTSAALSSLFLAVVLMITVIAVAIQKIPTTNTRTTHSNPGQQILQDLSLDAPLAPNKVNPDLYDFPRLGNVVAKTPGCGNSPEEAKTLGCIFDPMNWHWTRPECFYKEGSERAQAKGPWIYYRDTNFTE